MNQKKFKFASILLVVALLVSTSYIPFFAQRANAAGLTGMSDTMSDQKLSTASTHSIKFTTPTAINDGAGTNTIVITFPSDFNFSSSVFGDITMTDGATTGLEFTETVAASPSATAWGAGFSGTQLRVLTLTTPTDGIGAHSIVANDKIIVNYASTHSINASTGGSYTVTIVTATGTGNTGSDSGSLAVAITSGTANNGDVNITATVAATITMTNDDATIGFGTLVTANARYATNDGSVSGGSGTDSVAHTLVVATNAPAGYTLTYKGPLLTNAALNTIAAATITSDADGTPGTSQFALDTALTGTGTVASGYNHAVPDWNFVAGTTTQLGSKTTATATDSYAMHYLANISATQAAGSYSTTLTYIATGNF